MIPPTAADLYLQLEAFGVAPAVAAVFAAALTVPCACSHGVGVHILGSPHACVADDCHCRSFTAAEPLYTTKE
jgi:hypothetical protein